MVDLEQIKALRALGVKSIEIHRDGAHFVEFFPPSGAPLFTSDEFAPDTLVPPPDDDEPREPMRSHVPPALASILAKPSVS